MIPDKFHPQVIFTSEALVTAFGSKNEKVLEWCDKYNWLHYNINNDTAFCYICMKAERERKYKASTKCESAFISKGYTNWKDATVAFNKHSKRVLVP